LHRNPKLDKYIDTAPDPNVQAEAQQDEDARHRIILYVGQELPRHIASAASTIAAWKALEQELNEARRVRETILAAVICRLRQNDIESIADYLIRAQAHMVKAQDIESVTQAAQTCCVRVR
jgi:hypothetical protein